MQRQSSQHSSFPFAPITPRITHLKKKKQSRPPFIPTARHERESLHSSIAASLSLPSLATSPTTSPNSPFAASTSDESVSRRETRDSISARWAWTSAKRRSFSDWVFWSLAFRWEVAEVRGRERWAWRTVCGGRRSGLCALVNDSTKKEGGG